MPATAAALTPAALPLQLDGETIAVYALGSIALVALLFFGVKFAAGAREYLMMKRGEGSPDADGDGDAGSGSDAEDDARNGSDAEDDARNGSDAEGDADDRDRP